jgi:glycerol-3-phosphate cytidylyltransferase-like family protein
MNEHNACKLLFHVADALKDVRLPFCLGAGTLLGWTREDKFIAIDRDIDLWARAEEFEPAVEAIVKAIQRRGIQTEVIDHRHAGYWDGRPYAVKFKGYGEHGDLTAFTKLGPYRYNPTHGSPDPFCIVLAAEAFGAWRPGVLYGRLFNVPSDYVYILHELYDQWEVPDTEYNQPCEHRAYKPHFLTKQDIAYVPMCLDVVHPGHLNVLSVAASLDAKEVWIGLLSDEAICKYKPEPAFGYSARLAVATGLKGVAHVTCQGDYLRSLLAHKPAYVVHGDDWREGVQAASRQLVIDALPHWGGKLVEVPYTPGYNSTELKARIRRQNDAQETRR